MMGDNNDNRVRLLRRRIFMNPGGNFREAAEKLRATEEGKVEESTERCPEEGKDVRQGRTRI